MNKCKCGHDHWAKLVPKIDNGIPFRENIFFEDFCTDTGCKCERFEEDSKSKKAEEKL